MRPGPSRFCAIRKPSPRSPSRFAAGTRTPEYQTSQCVDQPRPRWPETGTGSIRIPGVSAGTRICDIRRCGSASGSVTAITIPNPAPSAPDENHLWPSITHSSPSSTARRPQPGRVRAGHLGLGHREERPRLALDERPQEPLLLLVRAEQVEDLAVAGVRRLAVEDELRPDRLRPISSFRSA